MQDVSVSYPMPGRVVLVTGANSGIGLEVARSLTELDADVVLACRNPSKGARAQDDIEATTGRRPELISLDLASLDAVRAAAEGLRNRLDRIDVLINNAGTFSAAREETLDGFEKTLGTNHLGPLLLTVLLLPLLEKSNEPRIVNVGSEASFYAVPDLEDLQMTAGYGRMGFDAYARSKAAQVYGATALSERLAGRGVAVNTVHPGHVATNIWPRHAWHHRAISWVQNLFASTASEAAPLVVRLAAEPELKGVTGVFYSKGEPAALPASLRDPELQHQLWRKSLELVGLPLDTLDA